MLRKIKQNFIFIFTISFLILAFLSQTIFNSEFKWINLLGTDGLTIFSIVLLFFLNLAPKIKPIRKLLFFLLLRFNVCNIDYEMTAQIETDLDVDLNMMIDSFHESILKTKIFSNDKYDLNKKNKASYKIYHRGMASNVTIKNITEAFIDHDAEKIKRYWEIKFDCVNKFSTLEKNIKFLTNNYLEILKDDKAVKVKKIYLVLDSKNSEFDISNNYELLDEKKYEKISGCATIKISDTSNIQISDLRGLTLCSSSKGDFVNGFDLIKSILIG